MTLALVIRQGESLTIGEAVIRAFSVDEGIYRVSQSGERDVLVLEGVVCQIGKARVRIRAGEGRRLRVFVDAPREVEVTRESAKTKLVHG